MVTGNKVMSALGARIWVLITDGVNTRICSSEDGVATPVTSPIFPPDGALERHASIHAAWFKAEGQHRLSPNPSRQHLWHLNQLLAEAARARAYDGLIIIAADPVAATLKEILAPETRALLIGKVVSDFGSSDRPAPCGPAEIRH
jgi:hypothetical protein